MKKLAIILAALFVASFVQAQTAVDTVKRRNSDGGNVAWKTSRTSNVDVPWAIVTNPDGTNVGSGGGGSVTISQATPGTTNGVVVNSSALPTGAATAALQPSLGTATTPSANVITTQKPAVTQVISSALEASHVIKASAGQLVQLSIFNSKASAQFILVMNATSLPSNGAVTLLYPPIPIAAGSLVVLDLPSPLVASTGIVVANSSTGTFSLTIGSADCAFYAQIN
jgi:hypothetical protein